ncbi:MAG: alpha/beta hydrolase [Bacilli bacterium]|nr:alpha/beta hydrolase [Bacilli bacterium]
MKTKYPIKPEFFPFNKFTAPHSKRIVLLAQKFMKTPKFIFRDKELNVSVHKIDGYKDEKVEFYIISPKKISDPSPAIIFIHGGGFVYEGFTSHFKIAVDYAKECHAKVIYIKYNLAPKYPFPFPQYECAKVLHYVYENVDKLGIDSNKIAFTGDSAGAFLCVSSQILVRKMGVVFKPVCQVLIYPWLDGRSDSESNKKYTDTPMWNSTLSKKSRNFTNPNNESFPPELTSVVEYNDLSFMPPTYIEVAEFDCLHDDGILFNRILEKENINVVLYEVKGTMHGYETKYKAPTTQELIKKRIEYFKRMFK